MKLYITDIDSEGTVAVDDTILVKDSEATAGSGILGGFVPLFDAEAVERIKAAGYKISGKTNVGEFGLDLLGETSCYGDIRDGEVLSGAAAVLCADKKVRAALCVDLNGAPRRAAALAGQTFIKPTYGTVSRYGVIPCACSGEQIGVMSSDAEGAMEILSVIAGHDSKDGTSLPAEKYEYNADCDIASMRICVIDELLNSADGDTAAAVNKAAEALGKLGAKVGHISVSEVRQAQAAWQILLAAETCNNISRYDGVKFGYRTPEYDDIDDLYIKSRTEGMGILAKETLIYGSDVLSKGRYEVCYDKALRIRRVIFDKFTEIFKDYDLVLAPVCSKTEYKAYDVTKAFTKVYEESLFTAYASITGMPAVVTHGVQFTAAHFGENKLFSAAAKLDKTEVL